MTLSRATWSILSASPANSTSHFAGVFIGVGFRDAVFAGAAFGVRVGVAFGVAAGALDYESDDAEGAARSPLAAVGFVVMQRLR